MTIDVDAVYEKGILTLKQPVDLPDNAEVHVTIQTAAEARTPLGRRLRELRAEIAKSGAAPLGWDEIQSEVAVRRGARDDIHDHLVADSRAHERSVPLDVVKRRLERRKRQTRS
jgi:predicted DNA-binding antitoxin AbrB/MazE fold protein